MLQTISSLPPSLKADTKQDRPKWHRSLLPYNHRMHLTYSETRFLRTRLSTDTRLIRSLRRSRTSPIGKHVHFFSGIKRRTERGTKSGNTYQFSLQVHFCPFFGSFFLITSMSSNLSVSISIFRHAFQLMIP